MCVRLKNGRIRTYRESVDHQLASSLVNLQTLHEHSKDIYKDFVTDRRKVASKESPYANRSFVILPNENETRTAQFLDLMALQVIDVYQTTKKVEVDKGRDQLGTAFIDREIPAGAYVIPNRQNEARLIGAILEFETRISDAVLLEERKKTLRRTVAL